MNVMFFALLDRDSHALIYLKVTSNSASPLAFTILELVNVNRSG